jgi:hypothetical protein
MRKLLIISLFFPLFAIGQVGSTGSYWKVSGKSTPFGRNLLDSTLIFVKDTALWFQLTAPFSASQTMSNVYADGHYRNVGGSSTGEGPFYHDDNRTDQRYSSDSLMLNGIVRFKNGIGSFAAFSPDRTKYNSLDFSNFSGVTSLWAKKSSKELYINISPVTNQIVLGFGLYSGSTMVSDDQIIFSPGMIQLGTTTIGNTITVTGGTSTNWNTAYGWGNHASAGYVNGTDIIKGTGSFVTTGSTVSIYIPGITSASIFTVSPQTDPTTPGSFLPLAGDVLACIAKTDYLVVARLNGATGTSGLTFNYIGVK